MIFHRPNAAGGPALLGVAALCALIAIGLLARGVIDEIRLLATANTDNVQWSVSQTEVEFLEFLNRVGAALPRDDPDLVDVRRRFDVFYSRVALLDEAPVYAPLRQDTAYAAALDTLKAFVERTVPIIDSPDPELRTALPELQRRALAVRPDLRRLSTASLQRFVGTAETRRIDVATTLTWLAIVVTALLFAMGLMVLYLNRLNGQNLRRGREIEQASHRLSTVISTALDAVIVTDGKGRILEFNTAAEEMFGRTAPEVLGRDVADVVLPAAGRRAAGGLGRGGRTVRDMRRRDGTVFPVELAVRAAPTQDGGIVIAFLRDVSRRVKAEADMIAARDQAVAGEQAKSDFLAVMSHEIRTPLNGLLGNLSLLRDTDLDPDQAAFVDNMETSGRLLMRHVTDVLDITRYDAGQLALGVEPVDMAALLQELIDNQRGLAAANGTTLDWQWIGSALPWIEADRGRLEHILLNLISNAVKFTHDGIVRVEGEMVEDHDQWPVVEFRVRDTGIGIPSDQQARIFDDFVTAERSHDSQAGGTGLGLGIVRRFAQAMGGDVAVDSAPGAGSVFRVRLPLKRTEAPAPRSTPPPAAPRNPGRTLDVLVVEDNEINRQVVREMLTRLGHRVHEAHNGRDGVDQAAARAYDLILMDIAMPVLDGRSAARQIRAGGGPSQHAAIVALTANVMPDQRAALASDGMTDVLHKPLSRAALAAVLADLGPSGALDGRRLVDSARLAELHASLGRGSAAALFARFRDEVDGLLDWLGSDALPPLPQVQERAHQAAGSAAMFGARALREALIALEAAAVSADAPATRRARAPLADLWARTRARLDAGGGKHGDGDAGARDPDDQGAARARISAPSSA